MVVVGRENATSATDSSSWQWVGYTVEQIGTVDYIIHELLAHGADLLGQGSTEHQHLLLVGRHFKYLLNVSSHICIKTRKAAKFVN